MMMNKKTKQRFLKILLEEQSEIRKQLQTPTADRVDVSILQHKLLKKLFILVLTKLDEIEEILQKQTVNGKGGEK